MHTVWKGALSLGLLNIGIKLYSVVEETDIKFLSLHKECLTPNLPSNENYPIQKQELTAAINLIHHLTNPFEQEMYTDEYAEALTELIENKIEQQEKTETISPAPNIINIMETLQASIEQAKIKRENKKEQEAQ
ncbi:MULTISPECIES: hypothetical protein [Bacillus cereus group]|uniref:Ku protein n=1 Tax=Bacillus wiedmannii TaxID=1890302 RepID=A0AB73R6W2_9BACI|nr:MULTISPECIES: hypothetical protein [Bacillus cereus group]KAA0778831.1 hypothetical protein DN392_01630 [Bacillus sp. BB51/4]PEK20700.1 hypothetical protein CN694_23755 [Bacillus wiedmannii]SCN01281.1 Protein of unknown function [Bacillus wiedmannii]HDR3492731.1 hypothetical protein [Bacillus wiedmannii]HDR7639453.1 hypothetical protein [Bacillus wiedmannii]